MAPLDMSYFARRPRVNRLQDVTGDADGDALGGFPDRGPREMRTTRCGFHSAVTEQPANDRQPLAEHESPRGEAVPNVMNAHIVQSGARPDGLPSSVDVVHVLPRLRARNNPRIDVGNPAPFEPGQNLVAEIAPIDLHRSRLPVPAAVHRFDAQPYTNARTCGAN